MSKNNPYTPHPEDEAALEAFRRDDQAAIRSAYQGFRERFLAWFGNRADLDREEVGELYQQAFTTMYFNIRNGKLQNLQSRLETYLFGIGKRLTMERYRERLRSPMSLSEDLGGFDPDLSLFTEERKEGQRHVVQQLFDQIGEPCRSILTLYYFRRFSMESIAERMGYKNDGVAKKKKYQCLQRARQAFEEAGIRSSIEY